MSRLEVFAVGTGALGLVADTLTLIAFAGGYWGITPLPTGALGMLILGAGLSGAWLLCVLAYRRVTRSPVLDSTGSPTERPPSRRARRAALSSIVGIPLACLVVLTTWGAYQLQPQDGVLVLVSEIDGPEPEHYRVTETILHNLSLELAQLENVRVVHRAQAISEPRGSETARAVATKPFGCRNDATIVIWGWYGVSRTHVEIVLTFELLTEPADSPPIQTGKPRTYEIAHIDSFSLQTALSREMVYLTAFVAGLTSYGLGDNGAADRSFTAALAQLETAPQSLGREVVLTHRGLSRYSDGNYSGAIEDYTAAIGANPEYADAWNNRGLAHARVAMWSMDQELWSQQADHDYTQAIRLAPDFAEAYNNRGVLHQRSGFLNAAMEDLTQAIRLDPALARAYYNRATLHSDLAQYHQAIDDYTAAIRIDTSLTAAYFGRGLAHKSLGQHEEATADLESYVRLAPADESPWTTSAQNLIEEMRQQH